MTEFLLNVTVTVRAVGRQRDLQRAAELPSNCNIYIVSSRPRMTVDPDTVRAANGRISLQLGRQMGSHVEHVEVEGEHGLGTDDFEWRSVWPCDEFEIVDRTGDRLLNGVVAPALQAFGADVALFDQHVLYVGQAFGQAGERTAWDRLRSHKTLQSIYAEARPDTDVWLSLCEVTDLVLIPEIVPNVETQMTDEQDNEHIEIIYRRMRDPGFKSREAVAIAEAGLIRYFRPTFNVKFRDNFPDPGHVNVSTAYELDFNTLGVELQASDVRTRYGSGDQSPQSMHFIGYQLDSDPDRAPVQMAAALSMAPPVD